MADETRAQDLVQETYMRVEVLPLTRYQLPVMAVSSFTTSGEINGDERRLKFHLSMKTLDRALLRLGRLLY